MPQNVADDDDATGPFLPGRGPYAGLPTSDDFNTLDRFTEHDPLYPPPPPAYYNAGEPTRITSFPRLFATLTAVGLACLAMAALLDASVPLPGGRDVGRTQRQVADIVLGAMDRSADPCEDFYEYACGSWVRSHTIPPDRSVYQKSFSGTNDRILEQVRSLLDADVRTSETKVGRFYESCLNQAALGGLKAAALFKYAGIVGTIQGAASYARAIGLLHAQSFALLYDVDVGVDEGSPERYALYGGQGGLGLPHPDDYFATTEKAVKMRAAYAVEIEAMLSAGASAKLLPRYGAAPMAARVLEFEMGIANITEPPAAMRDPFKTYNQRSIKDLPAGLHFGDFLDAATIQRDTLVVPDLGPSIVLDSPAFFDGIGEMMDKIDSDVEYMRVARAYLVFHLVRRLASLGTLGENLFHAHFRFRKEVYGVQKLEERWKFCQKITQSFMGDDVGREFVDDYFSAEQKDTASKMANSIIAAFGDSLKKQKWMDEETMQAAKSKLEHIRVKIGYTEKWDDYDGMRVVANNFADNVEAASIHAYKRKFGLLGSPIDHTRWMMHAHEVNVRCRKLSRVVLFPLCIAMIL